MVNLTGSLNQKSRFLVARFGTFVRLFFSAHTSHYSTNPMFICVKRLKIMSAAQEQAMHVWTCFV